MAVSKLFPKGTIVVITAKASISSGNPALLEYTWRKNGAPVTTILTGGVATLLTSTPGTYDVVVSHPNAEPVTSETFNLFYREPQDILRIIYQVGGFEFINESTGEFTNFGVVDWNIATQQYEFGPDSGNGFGTPSSGWWRVFAKEKDVSLDITLRGSQGTGPGGSIGPGTNGGKGGVGTLRRTFERNQLYSFRVGDDNSGGDAYAAGSDIQVNAPNGGRVGSGNGGTGGGPTYMKRGGTLLAVVGGGGGSSSTGLKGGDGGGLNVAGENGAGSSGGRGGLVVPPGNFVPRAAVQDPRTMTRCNLVSASTGQLSCDIELTANDIQNSGAWAFNNGGAGGSGVNGGYAGNDANGAGGGGSGWASSAVAVLSASLGGNTSGKGRGSVRIRKTGFVTYITQWYHTTGVQAGFTPTLSVTNTGSFNATISPQNEGTTAINNYNQLSARHYLVTLAEPFPNTNYNVEFTFISTTIAGVSNTILPDMRVSRLEKGLNQFRVWFTGDGSGNVHVREVAFKAY